MNRIDYIRYKGFKGYIYYIYIYITYICIYDTSYKYIYIKKYDY